MRRASGVGTPGGADDGVGVALEGVEFFAGVGIPDVGELVGGGGEETAAAIGFPMQELHFAGVGKFAEDVAGGCVIDADDAVVVSGDDSGAVGGDAAGADEAAVLAGGPEFAAGVEFPAMEPAVCGERIGAVSGGAEEDDVGGAVGGGVEPNVAGCEVVYDDPARRRETDRTELAIRTEARGVERALAIERAALRRAGGAGFPEREGRRMFGALRQLDHERASIIGCGDGKVMDHSADGDRADHGLSVFGIERHGGDSVEGSGSFMASSRFYALKWQTFQPNVLNPGLAETIRMRWRSSSSSSAGSATVSAMAARSSVPYRFLMW